jgi:hypothetical protein
MARRPRNQYTSACEGNTETGRKHDTVEHWQEKFILKGYQLTARTHIKLTIILSRAVAQTSLRRAPTQLLLHQHLVQASSVPTVVTEQTLAPQQRTDRNVCERAFSLPANRTSERLRVAELALRLSLGVGRKWLGARATSKRHGHVARDLLVDGRESGITKLP